MRHLRHKKSYNKLQATSLILYLLLVPHVHYLPSASPKVSLTFPSRCVKYILNNSFSVFFKRKVITRRNYRLSLCYIISIGVAFSGVFLILALYFYLTESANSRRSLVLPEVPVAIIDSDSQYRGHIISFRPPVVSFSTKTVTGSNCSNSNSSWQFDSTSHYTHTSGNRTYLMHAPSDAQSNSTHGLILSFHGAGGDSAGQESESGLSKQGLLIDNKGVFAVYPQGLLGPGKPGQDPQTAWQGAPYASSADDVSLHSSVFEILMLKTLRYVF